MPRSYKPEVIADNIGHWAGNALRFATREEAEAQVFDLMMRWASVRETRVVESDDPPNYRWGPNGIERITTSEAYLNYSKGGEIAERAQARIADRIDGYDRVDLGESPDF